MLSSFLDVTCHFSHYSDIPQYFQRNVINVIFLCQFLIYYYAKIFRLANPFYCVTMHASSLIASSSPIVRIFADVLESINSLLIVHKLSLFALGQSIRLRIFGITSEIVSFVDFMQLDELVSSAYIVTCQLCPFTLQHCFLS